MQFQRLIEQSLANMSEESVNNPVFFRVLILKDIELPKLKHHFRMFEVKI